MPIVILNTGCANLASITIAIKKLGYTTIVTCDPAVVHNAKKIVIPGVGSAVTAMRELSRNMIVNVICNVKTPVLGICLGMQLLCNFSEEGGGIKTLGILKTPVYRLRNKNITLPHIGWNKIIFNRGSILFNNIKTGSRFYFVHSYFVPINKYTLACSDYGISFSSVIQKNNFFGVQFHPEKSGDIGAQLLKNFLEI
ncbi:imidazole glycerol phosphate synthase subunit HisH [Buchnera aphidicola]|uniref:imidazole glycerol phosphate synthase subunit HisH n=1 Tax=Buchnera aphidicola TaxID=9 RepID=UPI00346439AF